MLAFNPTNLDQVFEIQLAFSEDNRGSFSKIFQKSIFLETGIDFKLEESYFSVSAKNVIRGMHFQLPPHQHQKIVFCPQGAILDVALDLRRQSPTYGKYYQTILSAENHRALVIPVGCAHGFKSLEDGSITAYFVSSEYCKEADTGILWNSFGLDWHCPNPMMSTRDQTFLPLTDFSSPF